MRDNAWDVVARGATCSWRYGGRRCQWGDRARSLCHGRARVSGVKEGGWRLELQMRRKGMGGFLFPFYFDNVFSLSRSKMIIWVTFVVVAPLSSATISPTRQYILAPRTPGWTKIIYNDNVRVFLKQYNMKHPLGYIFTSNKLFLTHLSAAAKETWFKSLTQAVAGYVMSCF